MRHSRTVFPALGSFFTAGGRRSTHCVTAAPDEVQRVGDAGFLPHPLQREPAGPGQPVADPVGERVDVGELDVAQEISAYVRRSIASTCSARSGFAASTSAYFFFAASRFAGMNSVGQLPSCGS